jgi:hypothetical protein
LELYRATTVHHSEHRTVSRPISSSVLTLVSSPCSLLHPGVFLSRDNVVNRAFAFSDDGAAVGLVVAALFRPSAAACVPDPIRAIQIKSNGRGSKIPVRLALLLKRP